MMVPACLEKTSSFDYSVQLLYAQVFSVPVLKSKRVVLASFELSECRHKEYPHNTGSRMLARSAFASRPHLSNGDETKNRTLEQQSLLICGTKLGRDIIITLPRQHPQFIDRRHQMQNINKE